MPLFCRHNRFTADCPICSKGTALEGGRAASGSAPRRDRRAKSAAPSAPRYTGPYAAAGPYEEGGIPYEVRLERVPGGIRLAEWADGELRRRAPVLAVSDLPGLIAAAGERGVLDQAQLARLAGAGAGLGPGASRGRAGELREELRVEPLGERMVRIGRWLHRPGTGEWELQQAPPMLPAARFVEALTSAALVSGEREA